MRFIFNSFFLLISIQHIALFASDINKINSNDLRNLDTDYFESTIKYNSIDYWAYDLPMVQIRSFFGLNDNEDLFYNTEFKKTGNYQDTGIVMDSTNLRHIYLLKIKDISRDKRYETENLNLFFNSSL